MATQHGPFDAPKRIDPSELMDPANQTRGNRWSIVLKSPDSQGDVIAKYETHAPIEVPSEAGTFIVLEVPDESELSDGTYPYSETSGYQ